MGRVLAVLALAGMLSFGFSGFGWAGQTAGTCPLETFEGGVVRRVLDGNTVVLEGGGQVRLTGIGAMAPFPGTDAAKAKLEALVLKRHIRLGYGGWRLDRYKRKLAQIFVSGNAKPLWVQGEMVRSGLARVVSFADNRACIEPLLQLERRARENRRGMWALRSYRVVSASNRDELIQRTGQFGIVRGQIVAVARKGSRIFLNFDRDWRHDFTVLIAARNWKMFAGKGFDLESLRGRKVQVRGWLRQWNGPMIEIDHPEQIELLN